MKAIGRVTLVLFIAAVAQAATLPGVRVQKLGGTAGFLSSIACDSRGTIYYTTTKGDLYRFASGISTPVAHVATDAVGDSGLLGMALRDDHTAIVHYTMPGQTYDVIAAIDLDDGSETIVASFAADIDVPSRGSSAEHHGGNPYVASDGSIFVGIGDYGGRWVASQPDWNGGRIWRIFPDGSKHPFATGFRNPFDMTYDTARDRLIVTDNGTAVDDEIDVAHDGDWCGWPATAGNAPPVDGATPPVYVFPTIVAPTGMIALNGHEPLLDHGYLLGAFVSKSIYYIPDIDARPLAPITLMTDDKNMIIDIAEAATGEIYFASGFAIYRLFAPMRGDCNGDGIVDANDLTALTSMLTKSGALTRFSAPAFGCDANADGLVDERDVAALASLVYGRVRAARGH
jgi:glucose/arabinose dehydrogenase